MEWTLTFEFLDFHQLFWFICFGYPVSYTFGPDHGYYYCLSRLPPIEGLTDNIIDGWKAVLRKEKQAAGESKRERERMEKRE